MKTIREYPIYHGVNSVSFHGDTLFLTVTKDEYGANLVVLEDSMNLGVPTNVYVYSEYDIIHEADPLVFVGQYDDLGTTRYVFVQVPEPEVTS